MEKHTINLLSADLLPEQPLVTLSRVVGVWVAVLVTMLAASSFTGYHVDNLHSENRLLEAKHEQLQVQSDSLREQITNRSTDPELETELAVLKLIMRNKQALYTQLTDKNRTYVSGFADSMTELANFHHKDISLTHVVIKPEHMQFSGLAKTPEAVPIWLSGFEQSKLLAGQQFKHLRMSENDDAITTFTISSDAQNNVVKKEAE